MPRISFSSATGATERMQAAGNRRAVAAGRWSFPVEAYLERDQALCNHVLEIEEVINAAETTVDEMAYELLAKEQPMAIDLRFILAVIKINGDLERIGDQSANIAEKVLKMKDAPDISLPVDINEMGQRVGVMIRTAIQALLEADAKMAESVLSMDDEVDEMNRACDELVETMQQHPWSPNRRSTRSSSGATWNAPETMPTTSRCGRRCFLAARPRRAPQNVARRGRLSRQKPQVAVDATSQRV